MSAYFEFGPFRLEPFEGRLWRGSTSLTLRPRTFAVLRHLVEHAGRLVTHDSFFDEIWGRDAVTSGTLNTSIRELRKALGDDARSPRYIETVYRRGFRFVAEVRPSEAFAAAAVNARLEGISAPVPAGSLHGRGAELARLGERLAAAESGIRQIVFVTGELGIGKTSLLRAFVVSQVPGAGGGGPLVAWGQGVYRQEVEEVEPYQPVLDALDRLIRSHESDPVLPILRRSAPSWLLQIPWVLDPGEVPELRRQLVTASSPRMLREFCVAVESIARERTLVLVLEDLHWSDPATVDLIEALAERTDPARVLLLASYSPVEAAISEHSIAPLRRKLEQRGRAQNLALDPVGRSAVESFLCERFDWPEAPAGLADTIHDLTDGNPLFMVTMTDFLVAHELIRRSTCGWTVTAPTEALLAQAPASLGQVVQDLLATVDSEDRELLEAASVAGDPFDAQSLTLALGREVEEIERRCRRLARWQHFIVGRGVARWPDGSSSGRFAFRHAVFRRLARSGISPARWRELHLKIADRLASGYAADAVGPAVGIAAHYREAGNLPRALTFLARAAASAQRRFLHAEAVSLLERALELLRLAKEDTGRDRQELDLRVELTRSTAIGFGWGSSRLGEDLARCLELSRRLDDLRSQAITLDRMLRRSSFLSDFGAAATTLEELRAVTRQLDNPALEADVAFHTGLLSLRAGELDRAAEAFSAALEVDIHPAEIFETIIYNPRALAFASSGYCAWVRGHPDDARELVRSGIAEAEHGRESLAAAAAQIIRAELGRFTGRADEVREGLSRYRAALESGGVFYRSPAYFASESWLLLESGDAAASIATSREGLAVVRGVRTTLWTTCLYIVLAEALQSDGQVGEGLRIAAEGLQHAEAVGERLWEAELHRLRGELLRLEGEQEGAEQAFRRALELSRKQAARSLELRAASSLARQRLRQGDRSRARRVIEPVLGWFDQGHDTRDLLTARALLQAL